MYIYIYERIHRCILFRNDSFKKDLSVFFHILYLHIITLFIFIYNSSLEWKGNIMESIAKTNALITKALEARDQRTDLQPEIREKT